MLQVAAPSRFFLSPHPHSLRCTRTRTHPLLQDDSTQLPKRVEANITSGQLHAFGLTLQLPIRGTGYFEVIFLGEQLRVFRSGNALAVQVKESCLSQAQE